MSELGDLPLRIGTRGSALALAQTSRVIALLSERLGATAEPVVIRTEGDIDKVSPLTVIGGRGVFTTALDEALLRGAIAAAVHSAKDLPSERPAGLDFAAFPEREDARDVLVSRHHLGLAELPPRPTVGTSSRRRAMQVRLRRPDARIVELRGNIDSRLRKALDTDVDAIVLAAAGVLRMGWFERVTEVLPLDAFVPSPGQGALAIEARQDDRRVLALLAPLNDGEVSRTVRAERAFLRAVGGGCTAPIGAHVSLDGGQLRLRAMLGNDEGTDVVWADESIDRDDAEQAAADVARRLLAELTGASRVSHPGLIATGMGPRSIEQDGEPVRSLSGLSVVVTRPRGQSNGLVEALRARGARPLELPTIRIEEVPDAAPLVDAIGRLVGGGYDWVVFTSTNAVDRVVSRCTIPPMALARGGTTGVAAVGRATAAALTAAGWPIDVVPDRSHAAGLVEALSGHGLGGKRVLYPKAHGASDVLPSGLRQGGAIVDEVDAYRTVDERHVDPAVIERIRRGLVDAVTFASPSAVRSLRRILGDDWTAIGRASIVCAGPVTADAARSVGLAALVVAENPTTDGVIAALEWSVTNRDFCGTHPTQVAAVLDATTKPRSKEVSR